MYEIKEILHSGRKGPRYEPVDNYKYDDMVGCEINWDINSVRQFDSTAFVVHGHPFYTSWHTSPVLQLRRRDNNTYELETINTIYVLEDLDV